MRQTSWPLRPALPLLLLAYLLLIVNPIAGDSYGFRTIRQKRTSYGNIARPQTGQNAKTTDDLEDKLERIFKVGDGPGLVLFNDTSQPTFKVQRSPDGKLNVVFNTFLIFQTTTSGTPTNNNNNNHRNIPHPKDNDAILFPDDEIICPERRQGKPYCTEVPNYLEATQLDKVNPEVFEKFKPYFKDDLVQPQNVTQRMNTEPLEEYYCSSTSHLIYPKSAETKESKWLLVVQHQEHRQGILVEQCDHEDQPCRFEESLPRFYKSKCKQHFVFRTMIVLVNGEMKEEQTNKSRAFGNNNNVTLQWTNNTVASNISDKDIICPGKTFCTEVPHYLERTKLDEISLEKFVPFKIYFRDDYTEHIIVRPAHYTERKEEDYCASKTQLVYPRSAQTKDEQWVLVLQHGDKKQGILTEQFVETNGSCRFEEALPRGFTSRCKQNFTFRPMVVLVNGELKEELIKIPSSCKCALKYQYLKI